MFEVVVTDRDEDFAALEEEWADLYRNSPLATPFQSWAWLFSWWEHYGEGYELRVVTVRDEDLLVGLMPLMLERQGGFGRLLFIGTGITDYLDILIRGGWESTVSYFARNALQRIDSWQVADLQQLRPEAATWSIYKYWPGPRTHVWQDNFPIVDIKPWEELLTSLSKKRRKMVRQTLRRAEADGVRCELVGMDHAKQAAHRLVSLHREAWQGRDIAPEHLTRRFEAHLEAAIPRMIACGLGEVSEFWQDKAVIGSSFIVFGKDVAGAYLQGVSQKALRRYQFSALWIWNALNVARSRNSSYLDLLRGNEPYKLRWTTKVIPNKRMMLGRNFVFWVPYASYRALYARTRQYVNSESSPRWVKSAAERWRALRHAAAQPGRAA